MLKPYRRYITVSVDDNPPIRLSYIRCGLIDEELPYVLIKSRSFQEILEDNPLRSYITIGHTFFRERPYVELEYSWRDTEKYYNFDRITIEYHYEPWNDASLKDIMEMSTAEDFIQYLKERGITICPILK